MTGVSHLDKKLSLLQSSGINCGGIWEVRTFDKLEAAESARDVLIREFKKSKTYDNFEAHKDAEEKGGWNPEENRLTSNLELIELPDWKKYFDERIEHWSNFELISAEAMRANFSKEVYLDNRSNFISSLYVFCDNNKLLSVTKINEEKFDTYDLWREQIFEDFVFEFPKQILVISFGWSS